MLVFCYLCEIFRLLYWWKCILISKSAFHCAICHRMEMWRRECKEFSNNFIRWQTWFFTCDWTLQLSFTINRSFKTPELSYFLAWHRHMFGRCRFIMFKKLLLLWIRFSCIKTFAIYYIEMHVALNMCHGVILTTKTKYILWNSQWMVILISFFCHYYSDYSFDFDFKFFIYITCARLISCNVI